MLKQQEAFEAELVDMEDEITALEYSLACVERELQKRKILG